LLNASLTERRIVVRYLFLFASRRISLAFVPFALISSVYFYYCTNFSFFLLVIFVGIFGPYLYLFIFIFDDILFVVDILTGFIIVFLYMFCLVFMPFQFCVYSCISFLNYLFLIFYCLFFSISTANYFLCVNLYAVWYCIFFTCLCFCVSVYYCTVLSTQSNFSSYCIIISSVFALLSDLFLFSLFEVLYAIICLVFMFILFYYLSSVFLS